MDAVAGGDLLYCPLSLNGFDRDLGFYCRAKLPVLPHVCLLRQLKSTIGPCPNFGEYLIQFSRKRRRARQYILGHLNKHHGASTNDSGTPSNRISWLGDWTGGTPSQRL